MSNPSTDFQAPWELYPEIPCNSVRWRVGRGEDAMNDWWNAMRALTQEQRLAYGQHHPGSKDWIEWLGWALEYLRKEER